MFKFYISLITAIICSTLTAICGIMIILVIPDFNYLAIWVCSTISTATSVASWAGVYANKIHREGAK